MLISRGLPAVKTVKLLSNNANFCKSSVRNSGHVWSYRRAGPPNSKKVILAAEIVQGIAWWWVLWHLWSQYDHVIGEFDYPDPSKWTDEELGIPPEGQC